MASVDLAWGGADGLVNYLQEESRNRPIPTVILTGFTAPENVAELREVPCVFRYLRKPFPMVTLLEHIRAIESDCADCMRPFLRMRISSAATYSRDFAMQRGQLRNPERMELQKSTLCDQSVVIRQDQLSPLGAYFPLRAKNGDRALVSYPETEPNIASSEVPYESPT